MKNNKNIILLIVLSTALSINSCTDLLDREPVSITHPGVFWVNESNAEQALAGSYALFKNAVSTQSNFLYWGEFTGMTFMNSQNWICNYIENNGNYVLAYRPNSRDWKNFYRAANWANTIEYYVSNMDENYFSSPQEKNRIIGEAAFVRALSYFWMTRVWGDIPIVKESIESSDQLITEDGYIVNIPRADEIEVLNYILEAVDKAIGLLEYSSPNERYWAITANKGSAEALKAHVTLWYASRDNGNSDMIQKSIDASTSVIQNSNAEMIDYVTEGEEGFNKMCIGQSKTGLFEINVSADMNESFRMSSSDAYYTGLTLNYPIWKDKNTNKGPYIDPEYYGNQMMSSDPDRDNDVRKDLFFYDYMNPEDDFLMKYSHSSPDPNSEDPYAKFSESNILIFRLADIYLLRAEAYARQGNTAQAIADINLVRSKANVPAYSGPMDQDGLMKAVFDERAIELVGEGQSGFDRIRMNYYYEGVPWMNTNRITKRGYYWPIDASVITVNPSIVQTEYWRGKL